MVVRVRRRWLECATRIASLVLLVTALPLSAQDSIGVSLGGAPSADVLDALAQECYEAGLTFEPQSDSIVDCSTVLSERVLREEDGAAVDSVIVRHKVRFTLVERASGEGRVSANAWTETEELGTAIEEPIESPAYMARVQTVMADVVARANGRRPAAWAGRYESEQAWRLDAHLKAVSYCDTRLSGMTAAAVGEQLESLGVRPLHRDVRDRCEQLYTHVFEWGLARGDAEPTLEEYARHRASLPPEQRACTGQLAPDATCRR